MAQIVHTKINIQRKFTFPLLCQLSFNFLLNRKSKIQHLTSNLKPNIKKVYEYIQIFSYTNIDSYHIRIIFLIQIYSDICLYYFFIQIYSDIHSYNFWDIDIFKYLFVSKFYIRHTLFCGI